MSSVEAMEEGGLDDEEKVPAGSAPLESANAPVEQEGAQHHERSEQGLADLPPEPAQKRSATLTSVLGRSPLLEAPRDTALELAPNAGRHEVLPLNGRCNFESMRHMWRCLPPGACFDALARCCVENSLRKSGTSWDALTETDRRYLLEAMADAKADAEARGFARGYGFGNTPGQGGRVASEVEALTTAPWTVFPGGVRYASEPGPDGQFSVVPGAPGGPLQ